LLAPLDCEVAYTDPAALQSAVESLIGVAAGRTGMARLTLRVPLSTAGTEFESIHAVLREAADRGIRLHVRTDLDGPPAVADQLANLPADVVSIDIDPARDGVDRAGEVLPRLWASFLRGPGDDARSAARATAMPRAWVVPRLARSVGTLGFIESFYDQSIMLYGAAVIDAVASPQPADIAAGVNPLALPMLAARRLSLAEVRVTDLEAQPCPA